MREICPLVVGHPRTGFTLLISVLAEISMYGGGRVCLDPGIQSLRAFCDTAGMQISARIEQVIERHGLSDDLLYNYNFKQMAGGPKWLKDGDDRLACFRKYIGIRGQGDFTLITSHPQEVLRYYDIIHSHANPARWVSHLGYGDCRRFASIRHPAATLASACFSLNALASEYIQRFVPPNEDNDTIRQRLALYKLSDLNFFEALIGPFKAYLEEFCNCLDQYAVMRWEDLIQSPVRTIQEIATVMQIQIRADQALDIWRRLDHVNLTGAHKHNLRDGHGVVGGWRGWLTNTHLDLLRDNGLDAYAERFGYGRIDKLDRSTYTPFQKCLAEYIERGEVFREYGDEDLFGFAFNKSNLDLNRFAFKRYEWRMHTQIERSSCTNDHLVREVWDVAEESCMLINRALIYWFQDGKFIGLKDASVVDDVLSALVPLFVDEQAKNACRMALLNALHLQEDGDDRVRPRADIRPKSPPLLLQSVGTTNIVKFDEKYYALPQSLGPIDFLKECVIDRPGVQVADSLSEILSRVAT